MLSLAAVARDGPVSSLSLAMEGVEAFLKDAGLSDFLQALSDLGVRSLEDLKELEPDDLEEIGMKKLQKRRLARTLGASERDAEPPEKRPRLEKPVARPGFASRQPTQEPRSEVVDDPAEGKDGTDANVNKVELNADILEQLNSLGQEEAADVIMSDGDLDSDFEIIGNDGDGVAQLIGLQTDLQDDMHVAKLVTSLEGVVALCKMLGDGGACAAPKLKVSFEKLEKAGKLPIVGVLGEQPAIRGFLESLQVAPQAMAVLKSVGLYALHHHQRLLLIVWPAPAGFQDAAYRRPMVSFVHFLLQLTSDIIWLVGEKDLQAVQTRRDAVRSVTSRNLDIQIGMRAASEDDCTLGSRFRLSIPSAVNAQEVRICSSRHRASLSMLRVQAAGQHEVPFQRSDTITNFFREVKDTHAVHFHPELQLEHCGQFLQMVSPPNFDQIQGEHQEKARLLATQRREQEQAIEESESQKREELYYMLREAARAEVLNKFTTEFFVLMSETECVVCLRRLDADSVRLRCDASHILHRQCLARHLETMPHCPICRKGVAGDITGSVLDLVDREAVSRLSRQFPAQQDHPLVGSWKCSDKKDNFVILEEGGHLILKFRNQTGRITAGTGMGRDFWYANMEMPNSVSVGTIRIKHSGDENLSFWWRSSGSLHKDWGVARTACKDPLLARLCDAAVEGIMKRTRAMFTRLKLMYTFAEVAHAKDWLKAAKLDLADTEREMLLQSLEDDKGVFNKWYEKLVPSASPSFTSKVFAIVASTGSNAPKELSMQDVTRLLQKKLESGSAKDEQYIRAIHSCRDDLNSCLEKRLREMADFMFRHHTSISFTHKKQSLRADFVIREQALSRELQFAYSKAMQALAPEKALKMTLAKMTQRLSGTFVFEGRMEVIGEPELYCGMHNLKVEKEHFEHAVAAGKDLRVELERLTPSDLRFGTKRPEGVLQAGCLGKDRAFAVCYSDRGKSVKFTSHSKLNRQELLHVKRDVDAIAFSEQLRMLAVYSPESRQAGIYAWDEQFGRHHDYCAPIPLDNHLPDAELVQMHFLPATKQLCFVFRCNTVRIFELVPKCMRPRGFSITPNVKSFVDSVGTALLALHKDSDAETTWKMDIFLPADGRKIKTLTLPLTGCVAPPCVDIVRLYGADFLVAVDPAIRELHGWHFKLQTAEQICSMEQLGSAEADVQPGLPLTTPLDMLSQVLSKFTSQPALSGMNPAPQTTRLTVLGAQAFDDAAPTAEVGSYISKLLAKLKQDTQKPSLESLHIETTFLPMACADPMWAVDVVAGMTATDLSLTQFVRSMICMVPMQIARAENESFIILKDGLREDVSDFSHVNELAGFISFGLYELILESNENPVVVISSMGKQSTGKSYMLNHLAGSCFDTAGGRCTDGVWMTLRELPDVTYILLDFEGLGSFERSAQEDMLLSVFNAAISHVSLFRTENRLDCDTANIFSRMQQGAKLIQGDEELFNGMFQIVVKDVVSDAKEVAQEFKQKIQHIVARDKEDNFFLRLYKGRVGILPFPALGRLEFYREFASLTEKVQAAQASGRCFESGRQFLRNTKLLMSKIAMKDWTPTDQNKIKMLLSGLSECMGPAVAAGCMALTEDGATPLLHLRSNKTFVTPDASMDAEPEFVSSVLSTLPDEGLLLSIVVEENGSWDIRVTREIMADLESKVNAVRSCSADELSRALHALAARRQQRIVAWLESNLEHIANEGDAQRLMMQTKTLLARLLQRLRLCGMDCGQCRLPCALPWDHDLPHDCGTDHRCHAFCHYCQESGRAAACQQSAGHAENHDCGDASHTCGQECSLSLLGNCGGRCVLKPGHSEDHLCGSLRHHCGKPCGLSTCSNTCVLPFDLMHEQCECHVIVCPNKCSFPNCSFMCSVSDHFHADGRADCMCDQPHQCPHECQSTGICEIYSELVVKKQKFTGKHDTFDYDAIETEQNGVRKTCCKVIPAKSREHEGEHIHSTTENLVHYCDEKCPTCGYYCTLPWGHSGDHDTRHGNMRRTYFVSDQEVFTLGSRKYAPAESGVAEMCNMYCHRAGRGHTHVKLCADYSQGRDECCISAMPGRRHSSRRYKPNPDEPKDEFTHAAFWESISFRDPCSNEDIDLFGKCNHFCPHESHLKDGEQPSFCTLPLWHAALTNEEGKFHVVQHGGIVSPDGHHFACSHRTGLPVHTIILLDKSTSMNAGDARPQVWPWRKLHPNRLGCALAAVQSFVEKRRYGSEQDLVSVIAFDVQAYNGPTAVPILQFDSTDQWLQRLRPSGGTSFAQAVNAISPCIQQTPAGHRCLVLFLSDGWDRYPRAELSNLFANAQTHADGEPLCFHTLQFPAGQESGKAVLEEMAAAARQAAQHEDFAARSSYMASVDGISLQEAFVGIAASLSAPAGGLISG
ncbi:unnamed protein product [Effrenium voratum]|nr:unnamed protein product [Effrenium voratum]CAJ1455724.1 unnamed protein product [Effrenium voratum]